MLGGYLMAVDNKKAALEAAMKNIKKKEKLMMDDVSPNAIPVLDSIASVVVKVVSISSPCRERTTAEMKNTPR